jgi:hypothetical protein
MFGHGQVEGFTEKYGMEYYRPRYDETPDHWLVERHEREIAPLLHRRWLFAESTNFLLYDFFHDSGSVDENVFAYSNRKGSEAALVIYNNRYESTHGTVDFSAAYADKGSGHLRQQKLCDGLGMGTGQATILAWRDSLTGLEYLRLGNVLAERGLTLSLHGYQCHVFLDWHELYATAEHRWDRLCDQLNGRGVPSLDDALMNLELQPVHDALRLQLDPATVGALATLAEDIRPVDGRKPVRPQSNEFIDLAWARCEAFLHEAQSAYTPQMRGKAPTAPRLLAPAFRERLRAALRIPAAEVIFPAPWTPAARRMIPSFNPHLAATALWGPLLGWCALQLLAESIDPENPEPIALDLFDRLRLREPFAQAFAALGDEGEEAWRAAARIKVVLLTGAGVGREPAPTTPSAASSESIEKKDAATPKATQPEVASAAPQPAPAQAELAGDELVALTPALWQDPDVRWLTGAHKDRDGDYLIRESYEELLWWLQVPSLLRLGIDPTANRASARQMAMVVEDALLTAEAASYRIDILLGTEPEEIETDTPQAEVIPAKAATAVTEDSPGRVVPGQPEEPQEETAAGAAIDSRKAPL